LQPAIATGEINGNSIEDDPQHRERRQIAQRPSPEKVKIGGWGKEEKNKEGKESRRESVAIAR